MRVIWQSSRLRHEEFTVFCWPLCFKLYPSTLARDLSPLAPPTKESLAQLIKPGIEFPLISHRDTEGAEIHGVFLLSVTSAPSVSLCEKSNVWAIRNGGLAKGWNPEINYSARDCLFLQTKIFIFCLIFIVLFCISYYNIKQHWLKHYSEVF